MVVLCFLYYEESVDVAFLLVVCILTKLLMIKVNQVGDPETYLEQVFGERDDLCLYTEMGVRLITGVYHMKTQC